MALTTSTLHYAYRSHMDVRTETVEEVAVVVEEEEGEEEGRGG